MSGLFDSFYANFFSIGALIPFVFDLFLAYIFLVTIREKSKSTFHLGVGLILISIFNFAYFITGSFYHPNAAYHRWFTAGVVLLSQSHINMFFFYLHEEKYPRFGKRFLILQYIVSITVAVIFCIATKDANKIYYFMGNFYDFDADDISTVIGIIILLYVIMSIVIISWKIITIKSKERWKILFLGITYLLVAVVPSILNIISRQGGLDRYIFQVSWDFFNIIGLSLLAILYINTTKDRTTFMVKITGISLITILLILQGFNYSFFREENRSFDALHRAYTLFSLDTEFRPPDMQYIVAHLPDNRFDCLYALDNAVDSNDFNAYENEFINTLIREKILKLPAEDFKKNLTGLLNRSDKHFAGYKNAIFMYINLSSLKSNPSQEIITYIDSLENIIKKRYKKIKKIPDENFRLSLIDFLRENRKKLKPFNDAITAHLRESNLEGGELKSGVLKFLCPMKPIYTRFYRQIKENHYISFMQADLKNEMVFEAGFSYLYYRKYLHSLAVNLIILLGFILIIVLIGFRFFFHASLVNPLKKLEDGIYKMWHGQIEIEIPIKTMDEIGFLTHHFNMMSRAINDGKKKLDEHANFLEEKVKKRTVQLESSNTELEAAMEEIEATNAYLIDTNKRLEDTQRIAALDMDMAANLQMSLLPKSPPVTKEWEIAFLFKPMSGVSGDFYDFYVQDVELKGLGLFDVSGHGIASSLITMLAKSIIFKNFNEMKDFELNFIIEQINRDLLAEIGDIENYITGVLLRFNNDNIEYVNAGHCDILLKNDKTKEVEIIKSENEDDFRGNFLGIGSMESKYKMISFNISKGDSILLFSDCYYESSDLNKNEYGIERIIKEFQNAPDGPPKNVLNYIMSKFYDHLCDKDVSDDLTVILLKRIT